MQRIRTEHDTRLNILSWTTNKAKKNGIFICQSKYVIDLLKKYNIDQCKRANTPMSDNN